MSITVALTVLAGPHKNRRYCFQGPVRCMVGRGDNCEVRFSGDKSDLAISRHHCRLDIDPPSVQIRDLGSLNGTYVNGKKLAFAEWEPTDATGLQLPDLSITPLKTGDIVSLGDTSFRIDIVECPLPAPTDGTSPEYSECAVAEHSLSAMALI